MITGMMARRIAGAALIGIDPAQTPGSLTLSESNSRYTKTSGTSGLWHVACGLPQQSTGKRVIELEIAATGYACIGIIPASQGPLTATSSPTAGTSAGSSAVLSSMLRIYTGGNSYVSTGSPADNTVGTVMRMYADLDTGKIWVAKNGVLVSGNPSTGSGPSYTIPNLGAFEPACGCYEASASGRIALTVAQMSPDPIPSGWEAWA